MTSQAVLTPRVTTSVVMPDSSILRRSGNRGAACSLPRALVRRARRAMMMFEAHGRLQAKSWIAHSMLGLAVCLPQDVVQHARSGMPGDVTDQAFAQKRIRPV